MTVGCSPSVVQPAAQKGRFALKTDAVVKSLGLKALVGDVPDEFSGVYAGDLLSRAMSHVNAGDLWITIMNNVNVIAVASLTEAAAVILAEGVVLPENVKNAAEEKNITVLSSDDTVYDICRGIAATLR